jgi:hypothetical protein
MRSGRQGAAARLRSQRRFLILISMAVTAYYALSVHLEGKGEYSGIALTIGRADRIPIALWVVFLWALIRYCQRLHEQWRIVGKSVMREFEYCDQQLVLEAARRSAIKQVAGGALAKNLTTPQVVGRAWFTESVQEMIREQAAKRAQAMGKPMVRKEPEPLFVTKDGKRIYRGFGIGILGADQPFPLGHDFMMPPWSRIRTLWHQVRAWARTAVTLPALLEYIAPLAIAVAAVIIAIFFHVPAQPPGMLGPRT